VATQTGDQTLLPPVLPAITTHPRRHLRRRLFGNDPIRSLVVTMLMVCLTAAFLAPLVQSVSISIKSPAQLSQADSPLWPAEAEVFNYEGKDYDVLNVPIDGTVRALALYKPGRQASDFIDPANPDAGLIHWVGSWRTLQPTWQFAPHLENYGHVWDLIDFPLLLFNTVGLALLSTLGTLVSCTLVAYGFARFRFPGRSALFTLLIATIFLPGAVTLIPTYLIWVKLGVVGSNVPYVPWIPLILPAFLANAYDVFLLRQYFMTIPRELDEAAAIDGAGSLRTLVSVVLPQAWPAIAAVGIFTFVYTWNDYFGPLIYLSAHQNLQPISVALARFSGVYYTNPAFVQAGTLLALVIPVLIFLVFQRTFTRGIVLTGVEK
jgi:multiple sugar transport system permease protein